MTYDNILDCNSKEEFYSWLKSNHKTENECWINCQRGKIKDNTTFYYVDAVYVALCFGWIDSFYKKIDGVAMQRFGPRKKNSNWSELNKERCRWLIKHQFMLPSGYDALPDLNEEFSIDEDILCMLKEDDEIWNNYNSFPDLYRRIKIGNIQSQRKNKEVFERMLKNFLEKTKENKTYGDWNDNGRLI